MTKHFLIFLLLCSGAFATPEELKDFNRRMELTEKAIAGDAHSMHLLGNHYALYNDLPLAERWFHKAAEKKHLPSIKRLITIANNRLPNKDYKLLRDKYSQLRTLGHSYAATELALLYSDKESPYFHKNKAFLFFQEAMQQLEVKAYREYGFMLMQNDIFEHDFNQAMRLFKFAAEKEDLVSMRMLGLCYRNGLGIKKDTEAAWQWYGKASQKGDTESMYILAEALFHGKDIHQNKKNALRYYTLASEKGHTLARRRLKSLKN